MTDPEYNKILRNLSPAKREFFDLFCQAPKDKQLALLAVLEDFAESTAKERTPERGKNTHPFDPDRVNGDSP